jgi:hypothetical protein
VPWRALNPWRESWFRGLHALAKSLVFHGFFLAADGDEVFWVASIGSIRISILALLKGTGGIALNRREKLVDKMRNTPKNIRFTLARRVAEALGVL